MDNFDRIVQKLDSAEADYQILDTGTPSLLLDDQIKGLGLLYRDCLGTLLIKNGKGKYFALLRRDDHMIDPKKLNHYLGSKTFEMCKTEDLKKFKFAPGLLSPILIQDNATVPVSILVDENAKEMGYVYCGPSKAGKTLKISREDLLANIGTYEYADFTVPNPKRQDNIEIKAGMRILSGITPSSAQGLHLGNYLGAVKPHIELQDIGECFYFIADYHALNTVCDPTVFENNVIETYMEYMALGIDPNKTHFYVESHISAIFELTEIIGNVVTLAEMKRMHGYKDKLQNADTDVNTINMGLFNYPILMAADILLFEPDFIPVGDDQSQHVEICRDIAKSFNNRYGDVLKVPRLYLKRETQRLVGTDGERKMSKSLGNVISIFADENTVRSQIMGVTTDRNRIHPDDPGDPGKNPMFEYMRNMNYDTKKRVDFENRYRLGTVGDVEIKKDFCEFFLEYFKESRARYNTLLGKKPEVVELMNSQAKEVTKIAQATIEKVRKAIGAIYIK